MKWEMIDSRLHAEIIENLIERGRCPSNDELQRSMGISAAGLRASLERLADNHALVLHPNTHDVWVIHPFSLTPTATWVECGTRGWWAPCLRCAFGVAALVSRDVTVHSRFGGQHDNARFHFKNGALVEGEAPFPFSTSDECERHGQRLDGAISAAQVFELAKSQGILTQAGLTRSA